MPGNLITEDNFDFSVIFYRLFSLFLSFKTFDAFFNITSNTNFSRFGNLNTFPALHEENGIISLISSAVLTSISPKKNELRRLRSGK